MKPDVSIIIVNYNTFEITCNCIRSVYEKTKDLSFEIILVDNKSTDRDPAGFNILFPQLTLIQNEQNLGFSKANNIGIEQSKGKSILLLNSDTILQNNAIAITHHFLKQHKEYGAVSAQLNYPDGRVQHCCQRFPSVTLQLLEKLRLHKLLNKQQRAQLLLGAYFDHLSFVEPDWIWGTFFMFPASALERMANSKLNEDYFMYIEDMQWCLDLKKSGYKIAYLPEARVTHLGGASSGKKEAMMQENFNKFIKANYGALKALLLKI